MPTEYLDAKCAKCKKTPINKVAECTKYHKLFYLACSKNHLIYNSVNELIHCSGKMVIHESDKNGEKDSGRDKAQYYDAGEVGMRQDEELDLINIQESNINKKPN